MQSTDSRERWMLVAENTQRKLDNLTEKAEALLKELVFLHGTPITRTQQELQDAVREARK